MDEGDGMDLGLGEGVGAVVLRKERRGWEKREDTSVWLRIGRRVRSVIRTTTLG